LSFKRAYGSRVTLVSGIRGDWLSQGNPDEPQDEEVLEAMTALVREGGSFWHRAADLSSQIPVGSETFYKLSETISDIS